MTATVVTTSAALSKKKAAVVSPCSRPWRAFCGSLLSLAVLAGLLPQLTTYDHRFTFVDFQATPLSSQ